MLLSIYNNTVGTTLSPVPNIILDIKAVAGLDVYYTADSILDQSHSIIENTMYNIMLFRLLHYTSVPIIL